MQHLTKSGLSKVKNRQSPYLVNDVACWLASSDIGSTRLYRLIYMAGDLWGNLDRELPDLLVKSGVHIWVQSPFLLKYGIWILPVWYGLQVVVRAPSGGPSNGGHARLDGRRWSGMTHFDVISTHHLQVVLDWFKHTWNMKHVSSFCNSEYLHNNIF